MLSPALPGEKGGRKTSPICGWVCWRVVCRVSQWVITYTVSQLQQQCRRVFFWGEVYFLDDLIDSNKRNAAKLQGRRFFLPVSNRSKVWWRHTGEREGGTQVRHIRHCLLPFSGREKWDLGRSLEIWCKNCMCLSYFASRVAFSLELNFDVCEVLFCVCRKTFYCGTLRVTGERSRMSFFFSRGR